MFLSRRVLAFGGVPTQHTTGYVDRIEKLEPCVAARDESSTLIDTPRIDFGWAQAGFFV